MVVFKNTGYGARMPEFTSHLHYILAVGPYLSSLNLGFLIIKCGLIVVPISWFIKRNKIIDEEGMATHSSIPAWRIPWTEEPDRLQSMGSQRDGHN